MKKLLLIKFISTLLLLCGVVVGRRKLKTRLPTAATSPHSPSTTRISLWRANMCHSISQPGVNHAQFAGIASHLEPDSVILRDPAGRSLQVLEQNYRNDPISQELLLSFYEGKTIDFLVQRADKQEIIKGKIVRSGYIPSSYYAQNYQQPSFTQPIIEVDGVLRFGLPGQPLFPALSGDTVLKPTLSWLLQTNDPGKFDAEISYVAGGMSWQSDYNIVVSDNPKGQDRSARHGGLDHHAQPERQDVSRTPTSNCWPAM